MRTAPRRSTGEVAQLVALVAAASLVVATGAAMRIELATAERTLPGSAFGAAWIVHATGAVFALGLPLPLFILERLLRRADADPVAGAQGLRWAAAVTHGLVLVLVSLSGVTSDLARASLLAAPCALVVVLLQATLVARALGRARPRALVVALGLMALVSLAAIAIWGIPYASAASGWLVDPIPGALAGPFADLLGLGVVLAALPAAVALVVALWRDPRRALRAVALLTAGLVAAAAVAKGLLLGGGVLHARADDSYWAVGVAHALLVAPLVAGLAWALLPRRPSRGLVVLTALGLVLLACACAAEVALGAHGMPRRYATYDEVFTTGHVLASVAWALVLAHLALWLVVVRRARRRAIPIEDLE